MDQLRFQLKGVFASLCPISISCSTFPVFAPAEKTFLAFRQITGGVLTGPSLNAKVTGGFAADGLFNSGAQQRPTVVLYGSTDDGSSFYINETGVRNPASRLTWPVSPCPHNSFFKKSAQGNEIGGKYAAIKDHFVVADNAADTTKSDTIVPVYRVTGASCC